MHYDIRLLVSFGLLILIWMVQLIVYPSFRFMSSTQLIAWHTKYTPRITAVVAPLMLAQLGISLLYIYTEIDLANAFHLALVISVWIITFGIFIPIHDKIQKGLGEDAMLKKLVELNWIRTVIWSIIFLQLLY